MKYLLFVGMLLSMAIVFALLRDDGFVPLEEKNREERLVMEKKPSSLAGEKVEHHGLEGEASSLDRHIARSIGVGKKEMSGDGSYVARLEEVEYSVGNSLLKSSDDFIKKHGREFFRISPEHVQRQTDEEGNLSARGMQKVFYEQRIGEHMVHGAHITLFYDNGSLLQVQARVATEELQTKAPSLESSISKEDAFSYVWTDLLDESPQYGEENGLRNNILNTGELRYYLDDYGLGHRLTLVYRFVADPKPGVSYEYIVDAERGRAGIALKNSLIVH